MLSTTLRILHARPARASSALRRPRILVAGLNPHAGEGGHLGREEIEVITPGARHACAPRAWTWSARCRPTRCSRRRVLAGSMRVLAMYHDQGLPVLKYASLRRRHQRHARPADHPHLGRSRHRARPGRHRPRRSAAACSRRCARSWRDMADEHVGHADEGPRRHASGFGQNFLRRSPGIIRKHRRRPSRRSAGDRVVEIGPGLGALTEPLLASARSSARGRDRPRPDRPPASSAIRRSA